MQLNDIEYFLAIASAQSLNHAAKLLFISPSALSMFLTRLEHRLGVTLFVRNKDALQLTEAGKVYYKAALQIADIKEDTMTELESFSKPEHKDIRFGLIGARAVTFATVFLPALQKRLPNHTFEFLHETPTHVYNQVADGNINFGIGVLDYTREKACRLYPLRREEIGLVLPEDHPINLHLRDEGISPDTPIDISICKNETMYLSERSDVLLRACKRYFKLKHFTPRHLKYAPQRTAIKVARLNNAFTLCSSGYLHAGEGMIFQRLKDPLHYELGVICPRDHALTAQANDILALLEELKSFY